MAEFTIVSDTHSTQSSLKSLFGFLGDFKNFKDIMPEGQVVDFQYFEDQCSFNIKGITPMTIRKVSSDPYKLIHFATEGLAKFNFTLMAHFIGEADKPGQCRVDLSGDLNPFIKSMAEKSLRNLVNTMSEKLSQLRLDASTKS